MHLFQKRFIAIGGITLLVAGLAIALSLSLTSTVFAAEKPEIFIQLGHGSSIFALAISPDGKYLASASHGITIWDISSSREYRTK